MPTAQTESNIVPVHKKSKRIIPGKYIPISLTSVIGKQMEDVARNVTIDRVMENKIVCDKQHGFVPTGRKT